MIPPRSFEDPGLSARPQAQFNASEGTGRFWTGLILACALAAAASSAMAAGLKVQRLRCEYAVEPLGIDVPQPRLSWELVSKERGQRQLAYQVLVASRPGLLRRNQGDLWDSGKVDSDQSIQVVYAGQSLRSRQRCYWKVRVWDAQGDPSSFSAVASWEMSLLEPTDWQAQWIGREIRWTGEDQWPNARWIWSPDTDARTNAAPGQRWFRRQFTLPANRPIRTAQFRLAADDYYRLFLNGRAAGHNVGKPYSWKFLNELDVATFLVAGRNQISILATNNGPSAGLLGQLVITFDSGPAFVLQTDTSWKTSAEEASGWQTAAFDDASWSAAREWAAPGQAPWADANYPPMGPCPI